MMNYDRHPNKQGANHASDTKFGYKINKWLRAGLLLALVSALTICLIPKHSPKTVVAASALKHSLQPYSVCIDPGHGGNDPGAQSGNLTEATINLQVAFTVRSMLKAEGYTTYMTRTTNVALTHLQRAVYCNEHHATILVAIHQNDFSDPSADYSTALYYKPQDLGLATALATAAGAQLGLSVTPPMYFVGGVLMHSTMPATLIESLFITNGTEANAINHRDRLNQEAQGIVNGIVSYLAGLNKHKV